MGHERIPAGVGLHRERLTQRLDLLPTVRLGLVIAPAGSGKTALMADWARSSGPGGAWCQASREESGASLLARMSRAWDLPVDPDGGVEDLLVHLHGQPGPHVLVIDDVHLLVQDCARRAVQTLMCNAPATTSILLGSRRTPDLDLVRCEVSVNPVVLGADDLRFRSWEVESLFRDVYGEPLLPDEAAALARYTGGWAAALHLFHLSTAGQAPSVQRRAVHLLAGRNRYAGGYLSRQVLVGLGPDRSSFLRRTAVFDVLTAARCNALLDRYDSQRALQDLVATQALTSTDDDGETFRYHEVLRRHLEAELEADLGETGLRAWYSRAAELLEAEGALTEALRVRARARDWMGVRALLVRSGGEIASRESSWTGLLPTAMLHDDPWIELAQAQRLLEDGQLRAAGEAVQASLSQLDDPRAEERARDLRAVVRAWESLDCPPTRRWYEQVAGGLRHLRVSPRTPARAGSPIRRRWPGPSLCCSTGTCWGPSRHTTRRPPSGSSRRHRRRPWACSRRWWRCCPGIRAHGRSPTGWRRRPSSTTSGGSAARPDRCSQPPIRIVRAGSRTCAGSASRATAGRIPGVPPGPRCCRDWAMCWPGTRPPMPSTTRPPGCATSGPRCRWRGWSP